MTRFEVPAGKASRTLKEAARQAEVEFIFPSSAVRGVRTQPIHGEFLAIEAFDLMLAGTSLAVFQHEESGVYTVRNTLLANKANGGSNIENAKPMNDRKQSLGGLFKGLLALAAASGPNLSAQDDNGEGAVYELSPFSVDASEDTGYRATTTLAGTRLKTNLKDVGASVSVITKEMFEDTGATDAQTILSYTLGAEVAGVQGNFAGGEEGINDQRSEQDANRTNPQSAQRVRGLAVAQLTRNYFESDIAFDSYNTDRITINRGPNSLLFGIGSAGGVINNSLKQASVSKDFGEVGFRFSHRGSHRAVIDYNKVLVDGRLAIRLAALNETMEYKQKPAYEDKERIYVALNAVLSKNENSNIFDATTMRANFEDGSTESNPPNVTPPGDGISSWFSTPDPALQQLTGTTFPDWITDGSFVPKFTVDGRGLNEEGVPMGTLEADVKGSLGIPYFIQMVAQYTDPNGPASLQGTDLNGGVSRAIYGFGGRPRRTYDTFQTNSYFAQTYLPGFRTASLPTSVFDNRNLLLSGTTNRVEHDFDAQNVVLEQTFFNSRAGIEIAYDSQSYSTFASLPFSGRGNGAVGRIGFSDIRVDVMETLSNDIPNPNVGRLVIAADQTGSNLAAWRETRTERESLRATAFYDLDFRDSDGVGWLGRHVITGLVSSQRRDSENREYRTHMETAEIDFPGNDFHFLGGNGVRNGRAQFRPQVYLGPSLLDPSIQSLDDIKITETINIPLPKAGDPFRLYAYNRTDDEFVTANFTIENHLQGGGLNRRDIDTEVVSMQSYLLGGNLVGLVGWRTDEQTNTPRVGNSFLPDGELDPASLQFAEPLDPESGNTFTWSLVGHLPENIDLPLGMGLSAHYNQSENFNPVGLRSSILGSPLPSPTGTTEEYGFTIGLLENRISARFNWYTTSIDNDTVTSIGGAQQHPSNPQFLIGEYLNRFSNAKENGLTIEEALAASGPEAAGLYNSYEEVYADIIGLLPSEVQAVYNFRVEGTDADDDRENVSRPTPTRSFVADGFELDIVGNITENWRVFANAAQQETVQSNIAKEQLELANAIGDNLSASNLRNLLDSPELGEPVTFTDRYIGGLLTPLIAGTLAEGTVLTELREWRVNAGTNYSFGEGRFKGVGVGGALRWQSEASTGYPLEINELGLPVPVLSEPFQGPEELNGDLWISYGRKILDDKADWKIQLNIRNAFGDDSNIPVVTNPDGKVAIFRNPLPTEVFLSNTIRF